MKRIFVIGMLLLASQWAGAQGDRWNVRGIGMARTENAVALGIEAIGVNPALLGVPSGRTVVIGLPSFGAGLRTMIGLDLYKEYFTGVDDSTGKRVARSLSADERSTMLSKFSDVGTNRFDADVLFGAVSVFVPEIGGIGISVSDHIGVQVQLPKDYMRLIEGLDITGARYDLSQTNLSAWWYRELNISYGRILPVHFGGLSTLYAGIGVKFVSGYGTTQTDGFQGSLNATPDPTNPFMMPLTGNLNYRIKQSGVDLLKGAMNDSSTTSFQLFPAPAGTGFGVDLGVCADVTDGVFASISLTDIGSIDWKKNTYEIHGPGAVTIENVFQQSGQDRLKAYGDTLSSIKNEPTEAFSTPLPTKFRMGVRLNADKIKGLSFFPKALVIGVDYTQGLNTSLGNSTVPRFSLGMEYRPVSFLPFRSGLSVGGDDVPRWAFGFGFDFGTFSLDLATDNFGMVMEPGSFRMVSFGLGMKLRF